MSEERDKKIFAIFKEQLFILRDKQFNFLKKTLNKRQGDDLKKFK